MAEAKIKKPARKGTTKPLRMLVHPDLEGTDEIQKYIEQGHEVAFMQPDLTKWDLILAPNAWRMPVELIAYVKHSVDASRAVKYPRKVRAAARTEDDDE